MNLPNKITLFRVFLIPFFVICFLVPSFGTTGKWIALALFIIASCSDFVDGKLARKYNLVTDFGKFMDPLADKLLVCSAMICLIPELPNWVVIIIIAREFAISGFRLVASDNGVVIAASYWGKFKTFSQMVMVIYMIVMIAAEWYNDAAIIIKWILIAIATALTIISLIDYMVKNISVISSNK